VTPLALLPLSLCFSAAHPLYGGLEGEGEDALQRLRVWLGWRRGESEACKEKRRPTTTSSLSLLFTFVETLPLLRDDVCLGC
jgi:hypothetical protein